MGGGLQMCLFYVHERNFGSLTLFCKSQSLFLMSGQVCPLVEGGGLSVSWKLLSIFNVLHENIITRTKVDVNEPVTYVPGFLHGLLGQVDIPVDYVEESKGQGEENPGILVDGTGAGQLRDLRKG